MEANMVLERQGLAAMCNDAKYFKFNIQRKSPFFVVGAKYQFLISNAAEKSVVKKKEIHDNKF
jgi:hypothetical protein